MLAFAPNIFLSLINFTTHITNLPLQSIKLQGKKKRKKKSVEESWLKQKPQWKMLNNSTLEPVLILSQRS